MHLYGPFIVIKQSYCNTKGSQQNYYVFKIIYVQMSGDYSVEQTFTSVISLILVCCAFECALVCEFILS